MRLPPVLLATAAIATGLPGCGGEPDVGDVVPRFTPELASPADTVLGDVKSDAPSVTAPPAPASAPASVAAPAKPVARPKPAPVPATAAPPQAPSAGTRQPAAPAPATPTAPPASAPAAPVSPAPQTTTPSSHGVPPGAFIEFCRQNPGACDG
jgi:hypothetical protein